MRILVTGGAGYIGSVLTHELLKHQHKVTVVDNLMYRDQSPMALAACLKHRSNFTFIEGDARDKSVMEKLVSKADVIIPLACIVGMPACKKDPEKAASTNLGAIRLILKLRSNYQAIIFPNTNSGYGIGQEGAPCTEESPLNPVSLYGTLKVQAEKEVLESGHAIVLRLATVFGVSPRMRLDLLVNEFVYMALKYKLIELSEGHFYRNYIHVRDVVRAFSHCIDKFWLTMHDQIYNIGLSDANLTKKELCLEIHKQVPDFIFIETDRYKDPDQRNYIVSNAKIEATGFMPQISLQEGIAELIAAYPLFRKGTFSNI